MKNKLLRHYRLASFLAGWLAVAALPPFYAFPVLFISFPILLWLINQAPTAKQAFKCGYYFGFAFFAFGLFWINRALLLDIWSFGWLIPLAFAAFGFCLGLFFALPAYLCRIFKTPARQYLAFAAWVVIFEWIRSFLFTGFPWNLLGSTLAFSNTLLQAASLGGAYLLSLLVVLACGAPILWHRSRFSALAIPACILLGLWAFGTWQLHRHPYIPGQTTVRLVQPAIPQTLKWNPAALEQNLEQHIKMSQLPGFNDVDFVVWGETAFPYALSFDAYHQGLLQYAVPPQGRLITGALRYNLLADNATETFNSMFVIEPSGQISAYYDKSHLVPFGEYIPFRQYLPDWIKPVAKVIGTFSTGSGPKVIDLQNQPSFGGLICYEVIFPHQILAPGHKPQWLLNLTNDGWYGNSAGPRQHLVAARLRAIEEGITIVRAAGSGISALISPTGELIGQIPLQKSGIIDVKLPQNMQFSTAYNHYGNFIPLTICWVLLISALVIPLYFQRSKTA